MKNRIILLGVIAFLYVGLGLFLFYEPSFRWNSKPTKKSVTTRVVRVKDITGGPHSPSGIGMPLTDARAPKATPKSKK